MRKSRFKSWQLPLLRFDMGRMFASLVGSSEENIRKAISGCRISVAMYFMVDEIDKAFAGSQVQALTMEQLRGL